jgi:hypothetical protein
MDQWLDPLILRNLYSGNPLFRIHYVGIIPVASLEDDLWNIDTLTNLIGNHLDEAAKLDFYQAQKRTEQLRKISTAINKRFTGIAGGVGSSPIPLSDIALITPLQLLLITNIGAQSGREAS